MLFSANDCAGRDLTGPPYKGNNFKSGIKV
jgi:hypothetical protein